MIASGQSVTMPSFGPFLAYLLRGKTEMGLAGDDVRDSVRMFFRQAPQVIRRFHTLNLLAAGPLLSFLGSLLPNAGIQHQSFKMHDIKLHGFPSFSESCL